MTKNIECVERLQAVVDELTAEGAIHTVIVAGLIKVIVQTSWLGAVSVLPGQFINTVTYY